MPPTMLTCSGWIYLKKIKSLACFEFSYFNKMLFNKGAGVVVFCTPSVPPGYTLHWDLNEVYSFKDYIVKVSWYS